MRPDALDDRHSQFLIIVGDACLAASLAGLEVDIELADGGRLSGIPSDVTPVQSEHAARDTGYADVFRIQDRAVALDAIVRCSVRAPIAAESAD